MPPTCERRPVDVVTMQALNSPIELGVRCLIVLTAVFPRNLDLSQLVLMDYCLIHSADIGGPPSLLPPIPARAGELGIKRTGIEHGLQVMMRAGMVDSLGTSDGLVYRASEEAAPFLALIKSSFVESLGAVANWVVSEFGALDADAIRRRMHDVAGSWTEEFDWVDAAEEGTTPC